MIYLTRPALELRSKKKDHAPSVKRGDLRVLPTSEESALTQNPELCALLKPSWLRAIFLGVYFSLREAASSVRHFNFKLRSALEPWAFRCVLVALDLLLSFPLPDKFTWDIIIYPELSRGLT